MKTAASKSSSTDWRRRVEDLEARNVELLRRLQIIEEARAYLADQYDFAPIGFVTLDAKGCVREINLTAARLLGRERASLLTMPFLTCIAKPSARMFLQHLRQCRADEAEVVSELALRIGSRASLQVELHSVPVVDPRRGDTVYRTAITDITERLRAARALRESEKSYRVVDFSPDGIFILIHDKIVFANRAAVALSGLKKTSELIGRRIVDLVQPVFRQIVLADALQAAAAGTDSRIEVKLASSSGARTEVEVAARDFTYDGERALLVIARDITERRKAERLVLAVSEEEKARFGRDLHDGLCQTLGGVACLAEALRNRLRKAGLAASEDVQEIAGLIRQCMDEARGLAKGSYPIEVEKHGLVYALHKLAEEVMRRSGLDCRVECDHSLGVQDAEAATNLYRIVQEAIANAIKHGGARSMLIRLTESDGTATLSLHDDGIGLPAKPRQTGMGLYTMRYRATMIGGSLDVRRGDGEGTVVTCSFPSGGRRA